MKLSVSLSLNYICDSEIDDELESEAQVPIPSITTANELGEVIITWSQDMKVFSELGGRRLSQEGGLKVWLEPGSPDVQPEDLLIDHITVN